MTNAPSERRVAVRQESSQATPCHYATPDRIDCRWAKIRDISRVGVGLLVDAPFASGTRVIIELPAPTYQAIHPAAATVIRADQQDDGAWLVGCAFDKELSDSEFQKLL